MIQPQQAGSMQYIWAVVVMALLGLVLVFGILFLRPASDPMTVLGEVGKWLAPTTAAIMAYMKSQETHLMVNSKLQKWMDDNAMVARNEGERAGADKEQARTALEQSRVAATPPIQQVAPTLPVEVPVEVVMREKTEGKK